MFGVATSNFGLVCIPLASASKQEYKLRVRPNGSLNTLSGMAAVLLWSSTFAIARSVSEQVGPLTSAATVYLAGGFFCLLKLILSRSITSKWKLPRLYLFGCGGLFVFYTAAIYLAVGLAQNRQQLLEIALLNYLWPAMTILFSLLLLNKHARLWLWPGTVIALTGVFLVMTQGGGFSCMALQRHLCQNPAAYALALSAAFSWAFYSNLVRRWSDSRGSGAVELFIPATGVLLLALRAFVSEPSDWTLRAGGEALALAAVTTLGYVLWDVAMRKGDLLLVVAISYLTPLLSTLVSCLYLGVSPAPRLWTGCLLLIAGSFITWLSVSDKPALDQQTAST